MKIFLHKLFHWEYWPFQMLYFPVFFQWIFYAYRTKSFFFFKACNPSFPNGGFFMDSKKLIYDLIPSKYYPKTILIKELIKEVEMLNQFENAVFSFPVMVKPDIGLRGSAVKKISNIEQLKTYHQQATFDYLIQDFIPFPNEIGVFYVRYPNQNVGKITGIVAKEFLVVEGNGIDSIEDLLKKNPRFEIQLKPLRKEYGKFLNEVLPKNQKVNLVPYGNHARGAKFIDRSDLISEQLTKTINDVCLNMEGFYFGRIDLMYQSIENLEAGRNFSIVEVNGAASEPTHIYDPKHSVFFGWKVLLEHIKMMFEISVLNHSNGYNYLSFKEGMQCYRQHKIHNKKILKF